MGIGHYLNIGVAMPRIVLRLLVKTTLHCTAMGTAVGQLHHEIVAKARSRPA